ncbi:MDR family MFS transporter [Lacticaseibacillus pabuli]|uniref:MDR family MFS transporter n=1 Tax=Lacticaseibacillus pabuli TaxID=3025672 RepID=A0ABY7WNE4_9LACO|nr:MDR family MFS transporter [Lacticaseibacillus sp. KACC 23028]WDF81704.1 MDR family MFS transporter [Lacticaseibacillus sp. KACC 23028]
MTKTKTKADALPRAIVNQAWIIVLGAIAPMLDSTMVNIALNKLSADFHQPLSSVQWVVTGYLLAMVIAVPFTGWLNDRIGGKKVFLIAEAMFGVSSLVAALSGNLTMLIGIRFIQGFSAGLITPLLTTLLVDVAGSGSMGRIMAIVGLPIMLGPIFGPVIGGLIVQYLSWRWIFFVNVPVVIVAFLLIWLKLPAMTPKNRDAKFDWVGVTLLAAGSASIVYGIVKASVKASFTNTATEGFVGLGVALVVLYVIYAYFRKNQVVVPLTLFKHRNFTGSMIGLVLAGIVTNGPMLLLPLFFQNLRGQTVAEAGLSLIPQGIGMLMARPVIGRYIDRIGARWVLIAGLAVTLVGTVPFLSFDQHTNFWLLMVVLFIRGLGAGAIISPLMTDSFVGQDLKLSGQISIAGRITQNVGGALGSALMATVVSGYMTSHAAAMVTGSLTVTAQAYQQAFIWAVACTALLIVPAFLLTNRLGHKAAPATADVKEEQA